MIKYIIYLVLIGAIVSIVYLSAGFMKDYLFNIFYNRYGYEEPFVTIVFVTDILEWALYLPVCAWIAHQVSKRKTFMNMTLKDSIIDTFKQGAISLKKIFMKVSPKRNP